jgi:hypothetical protein
MRTGELDGCWYDYWRGLEDGDMCLRVSYGSTKHMNILTMRDHKVDVAY